MAKVPRTQLAKILLARFGHLSRQRLAEEVAAYLLETGRTNELDSLLRDIMKLRAEAGIVEVIAVSAHKLSTKDRQDIEAVVRRQYPAAKGIIISEEHNPLMLGGVRIELASQQLDLSVRAKLNKFKQLTA